MVSMDAPYENEQETGSIGSGDPLSDAVSKLNSDIQRISSRMCATLAAAEGNISGLQTAMSPVATGRRPRIENISAEVVDSNPYSRLMALQKMGVVEDYVKIRQCIGRLILYDYDTVQLANMNRLFYRPEHCGVPKTTAAASVLSAINPDVELETFNINITTVEGFRTFKKSLVDEKTGESRVALVLSCVDNYEARIHINRVCLDLSQPWMESGVSEDAVSGISEASIKREQVCAASLPTTMGIIAGLLVQNALKHLLSFGEVSGHLGYSALSDFFPKEAIKPNTDCKQATCRSLQQKHKEYLESDEYKQKLVEKQKHAEHASDNSAPTHEANEWKIELVGGAESDIEEPEEHEKQGRQDEDEHSEFDKEEQEEKQESSVVRKSAERKSTERKSTDRTSTASTDGTDVVTVTPQSEESKEEATVHVPDLAVSEMIARLEAAQK